ncbi:MAG: methyltransferase domain-containing protein, partial [Planctomycetaceae bacterium]
YRAEKKALDLGAGATRREWPDHTTCTTDIRGDVGADYVMDTRALNFPDGHFDLVASSHHLEHIPRWEQEEAWREIYRVTKPGGAIEHIVPNCAWAAAKILDGETDLHVMNVLYGAQEAHGYAREFNLHYFGYTPEIAKSLAESAGFEEVTLETYKDRAELGYNLIIRARKPATAA